MKGNNTIPLNVVIEKAKKEGKKQLRHKGIDELLRRIKLVKRKYEKPDTAHIKEPSDAEDKKYGRRKRNKYPF